MVIGNKFKNELIESDCGRECIAVLDKTTFYPEAGKMIQKDTIKQFYILS